MERSRVRKSETGHTDPIDLAVGLGLALAIGAWAASCSGKSIVDQIYKDKSKLDDINYQRQIEPNQTPKPLSKTIDRKDLEVLSLKTI